MNIISPLQVISVIILCNIISIGITMLAAKLFLKNGLDNINVTNLIMVETCVFAFVLGAVLLILR